MPGETEKRRRQLEGLEGVGRSPGSLLTQMLAKMVVEVGPSKTNMEAGCVRPKVGGRLPRVFQRRTKQALEVLAGDSGSLQDKPVPKEYQAPHL